MRENEKVRGKGEGRQERGCRETGESVSGNGERMRRNGREAKGRKKRERVEGWRKKKGKMLKRREKKIKEEREVRNEESVITAMIKVHRIHKNEYYKYPDLFHSTLPFRIKDLVQHVLIPNILIDVIIIIKCMSVSSDLENGKKY